MRAEELFEELSKVVVRWRSLWLLIAALWASVPALATVARAAEDLPQSSAGDVAAGILAGLILAGLIVYALCLAVAPVVRAQRRDFGRALLFLTGLLILKIFALRVSHGFTVDVGTYEAWGLQLAAGGPASMYQSGFFLDYPPGYLYALWAAGTVAKAIGASGDLLRMVIGSPPLLADFALAILIFALVRRFATRSSAWLALLLVALNPALLFDSIVWIQSDSALALVMFLSVVMLLDEEMEVAWALAALSVLMKPQALALIPVLAVWSAIRGNLEQWLRAGLAIIAVVIIGVAPFQVGHPWNWLPQLYLSTAAYYHETSVNAFNFMALLGGIRASDADTIFGLSYFSIGLGLLVPLYGFVAWLLWRYPTRRNLLFAAFIAVFGFFMFAPRMHERYLYPAIVLVVPLAVTESGALALFALLTLTGFINLADVLHTLQTSVFLSPREPLAMAISIANLLIFALAAFYFYTYSNAPEAASDGEGKVQNWTPEALLPYRLWVTSALKPQSLEDFVPFAWLTADTIAVLALVGIAGALRFWNLGHPNEIVFDEVHFVGQARHYIHGEPFLDPHPPLAKLLIAGGILLFGDHSRSWRL
ncbi:MAG TPA: phospholipid carrier-dependent glycosyltransferase, partial [Candidatus Binataceae bacterium]|nr:phospholipid carrier-dependent glycosyltransferase [Candidatus Binataceae bacterium]